MAHRWLDCCQPEEGWWSVPIMRHYRQEQGRCKEQPDQPHRCCHLDCSHLAGAGATAGGERSKAPHPPTSATMRFTFTCTLPLTSFAQLAVSSSQRHLSFFSQLPLRIRSLDYLSFFSCRRDAKPNIEKRNTLVNNNIRRSNPTLVYNAQLIVSLAHAVVPTRLTGYCSFCYSRWW